MPLQWRPGPVLTLTTHYQRNLQMAVRSTNQPIIFTDDAWIMSEEPPLTPEIIREKMIRPLEGIPAALWWSVGDHEVYHHETEIRRDHG